MKYPAPAAPTFFLDRCVLQKPKQKKRSEVDINAIARDLQELEILDEVRRLARKHGVLLRAALGSARTKNVVLARDAIIEFLRERFQYSSPEAGNLLRMNHTSVQESMRRTKARKNGDGG
jgi:chromosomal replication initiation ATPase DnaA